MKLKNLCLLAVVAVAGLAHADTTTTVHAEIGNRFSNSNPGDSNFGPDNITSLFGPAITPSGQVYVTGVIQIPSLALNDVFIASNNAIIGQNNGITAFVAVGSFPALYVNGTGNYAYSPRQVLAGPPEVAVGNVVASGNNVRFKNGDPLSVLPGQFILNCFRNQLMDDNSIATVALYGPNPALVAGAGVAGRMLILKSSAGVISKIIGSTDAFDGGTVNSIFNDYKFTANGVNKAVGLSLVVAGPITSTNDARLVKFVGTTPTVVAREGSATGSGGNWGFFNFPQTNDSGTTLWSGNTSETNVNARQIIAADGAVIARGTDIFDNTTVANLIPAVIIPAAPSQTAIRIAALNNGGYVAHLWGNLSNFRLFLGKADIINASRFIVENGSRIDTDGDYIADATLNTIEGGGGNGPMVSLSENLTVAFRATYLRDGDTIAKQGIVSIPVSLPGDADRDGFRGLDDFNILSNAFNSAPGDATWEADADFDFDGFVGLDDFNILSDNFNS